MNRAPRGWNPKHLGIVKSANGDGLETEVWLYKIGSKLDICVSVAMRGTTIGQTIHTVRLPQPRRGQ